MVCPASVAPSIILHDISLADVTQLDDTFADLSASCCAPFFPFFFHRTTYFQYLSRWHPFFRTPVSCSALCRSAFALVNPCPQAD
jgi:hypothetical protein